MKQRVRNIFNALDQPVDAILIKNGTEPFLDDNFFYATGLIHGLFEGSYAVLFSDGSIDFLTTALEAESAKKAEATIHVYNTKEDRESILKSLIGSLKTIGMNFPGLSHQDFTALQQLCPSTHFVDVSKTFSSVRLIKDAEEIKCIKTACTIADAAMEKIPEFIHEGLHEYELAAEINYLMQKHGAEKPSFDTISSFGKNSAEPHYSHGDAILKQHEFVLCDFGATYERYASDTTRTFVYGSANQKQKDMHETVLRAQNIAFDYIRPGVKATDVHQAVSTFIDSTSFKGCFTHSTGHSLGLAVHDGAGFNLSSDVILKENMVFTVEPGVYIPGFGGVRIEDDILITKNGMERLTKSSQELREL